MVVTSRSTTSEIEVMQARTACLLTITVHAPQRAWPQPNFVPVNPYLDHDRFLALHKLLMSVRREREHVSLPLNAVAMSFAVSSLHHKNRLNCRVAGSSSYFIFALFTRAVWRDRRSSTLPEGGMDRLHNALSRICIWRKRGLLGGFRFWSAVLTHDP